MALIQCPECGARISDAAPSCPECGYKFKNQTETGSANKNATNSDKSQSVDSILDAKANNYFWKSTLLCVVAIVCCLISSVLATAHVQTAAITISMLAMFVVYIAAFIVIILGHLVDRQWILGSKEKSNHYSSLISNWHTVFIIVIILMAVMMLISLAN